MAIEIRRSHRGEGLDDDDDDDELAEDDGGDSEQRKKAWLPTPKEFSQTKLTTLSPASTTKTPYTLKNIYQRLSTYNHYNYGY